MKRNCKFLKQGIDKNQKKIDKGNTTATTSTSDNKVTLLYNQENCCHIANQDIKWIVDSAASYHYVQKREYFSTYKAGDFGDKKMGNISVSQIVGIDNICIQTSMGCTLTLKDVQHIPNLRLNLISIHMLDNDGYSHSIGNDYQKLTKGSLVAAQGKLCYSLYKTHMKVYGGQLNTVEDDVSPNLWHKQLAHGLQLLAKQFLIPMTKDKLLNPYDHCLFRKQHRVSFQKNVN